MECKLEGLKLDEAVGIAMGWHKHHWNENGEWDWRTAPTPDDDIGELMADSSWSPSTSWGECGKIVESERIYLVFIGSADGTTTLNEPWGATANAEYGCEGPRGIAEYGRTPLIAATRAFVALKTPNVKSPATTMGKWNKRTRTEQNSMNTCKTCKHRNKDGDCTSGKFAEDWGQRDEEKSDMLIYSYSESGSFWVGENFGCVHYTPNV